MIDSQLEWFALPPLHGHLATSGDTLVVVSGGGGAADICYSSYNASTSPPQQRAFWPQLLRWRDVGLVHHSFNHSITYSINFWVPTMDQILSQAYDWEARQIKPLHACHFHSEHVAEGKEKEELDMSKSWLKYQVGMSAMWKVQMLVWLCVTWGWLLIGWPQKPLKKLTWFICLQWLTVGKVLLYSLPGLVLLSQGRYFHNYSCFIYS